MKYITLFGAFFFIVLCVNAVYADNISSITDLERIGLNMRGYHMMNYGQRQPYKYWEREVCFDIHDPSNSIDIILYQRNDLKLTENQIGTLKQLESSFQQDGLFLTNEIYKETRKFVSYKSHGILDVKRLQILNRIQELIGEIASRKTATYIAARNVLTLEQEQMLVVDGIYTCHYGYPNPGLMMP